MIIQENDFAEHNRKATRRVIALCQNMSDADLLKPIRDSWTIAVALAHLAFWDQRVIHVIDLAEKNGKLFAPTFDDQLNEIVLPFLAAIPAREAVRITIHTAEMLDAKLEQCPVGLIEEMLAVNSRLVFRAIHRNEHLDEIELALKR